MPRRTRVPTLLAALTTALLFAPAPALASFDLTHGQRFGDTPNEIVDIASDGTFLVATQGKGVVRYDLGDLGAPVRSALFDDLATRRTSTSATARARSWSSTSPTARGRSASPLVNAEPGPTSVALVRDEYVIAPVQRDERQRRPERQRDRRPRRRAATRSTAS